MTQVPRPDWSELGEKLAGLRAVTARRDCDTVVLRKQASLSWLLGARSNVPNTLDAACFDAVAGPTGLTIVVNAIEAPRLRATELAGLPAEFRVVDWWDDRSAAFPSGPTVAADTPVAGAADLSAEVAALRRRLTPAQRSTLIALGRDAAAAATRVAASLNPTLTEYRAAGLFAAQLMADAMDPIVLMVAGRNRLPRDRHPIPTTEPLGERAMLVCCARRHGLVASVTRLISFEPLTTTQHDRYLALLEVEADFWDASRPGTRLGVALREGVASYAEHGFAADEWHRHHQGGFSGWEPREYPARPDSTDLIETDQALAWNPSADGWKVEDTCLVAADGLRPAVGDDHWPTVEVRGRARPDVLVAE